MSKTLLDIINHNEPVTIENQTFADEFINPNYINGSFFINVYFKDMIFDNVYIHTTEFQNCRFSNCQFLISEVEETKIFEDDDHLWYRTDFTNCEFKNCVFQNMTWRRSYFLNTTFQSCKINNLKCIATHIIESRFINTYCNTIFFRHSILDFLEIKQTQFVNLSFDFDRPLTISNSDNTIIMRVLTSEDFNTAIELIQNKK